MTGQRTGLFPWPIALALFLGAAVTREPVVLLAAAAALAGWAVSFFTSRIALRGVEVGIEITPENLKHFDAVFFYTTGELPLSDTQKDGLLSFVRSGKGFGGSHSATDTFYGWKDYGELIGAYFDGHPWHTKVNVIVEDKTHPATKHLGDSFTITDEIYQFRTPFDRG